MSDLYSPLFVTEIRLKEYGSDVLEVVDNGGWCRRGQILKASVSDGN